MELIKLNSYELELVNYSKEIIGYLIKSGAKYQEAEDICQNVLLKLLESEIILPPEKIRAWMYRVAVRQYIDNYRRNKKYLKILRREFFNSEKVIEFDNPDYLPLYDAVCQLPKSKGLILDLYYFQDFSIKEISNILDITQSKVKIDLYRGRKQLKDYLEKRGYQYEDFK